MRTPIDLTQLKVFPLAQRASQARLDNILVDPDFLPSPCSKENQTLIRQCARKILRAREKKASVFLIFGAHLVKNGAAAIVRRFLENGWLTHLATNGAGAIHDWEFAFAGVSTESVRDNVATGTFGAWAETGQSIHLALLAGALRDEGFGQAVGRLISEGGVRLPSSKMLKYRLKKAPSHRFSPARAELLRAMRQHGLTAGWHEITHSHKENSLFMQCFQRDVPITVHPGIGYDIISNHPLFNGAAIGRAAEMDFRLFGGSLEGLDDGVVLNVGSAIMGPQVFEKSLSCVNNLRVQAGRPVVAGHTIFVVDIQDGGRWDWTTGEPPKDNPAYYLRFCKSYSRMGGTMHYLQLDNVQFLHHLLRELTRISR